MELATITNYETLRDELRSELNGQADSFVRTGYLLKRARDTEILADSGYTSVFEFAKGEYGLTKDVVSRYIGINDRFSAGGYGEVLQDQFKGYGIAKLQEMLTLPGEVVDLLSPEMTRREIADVKKEYQAEMAITPLEAMTEERAGHEGYTIWQKALYQYCHEKPEVFEKLERFMRGVEEPEDTKAAILEEMAPSGIGVKNIRIPAVGRVMISFKADDSIEIYAVRTGDTYTYTWNQLISEAELIKGWIGTYKECWETLYGEPYPEKTEVAPVQQEEPKPAAVAKEWGSTYRPGQSVRMITTGEIRELVEKTETEKIWQTKGTDGIFAFPENSFEEIDEIEDAVQQEDVVQPDADLEELTDVAEEQLPGQQSIEDYPEYMPKEQTEVIPPEESIDTSLHEEKEVENDGKTEALTDADLKKLLTRNDELKAAILENDWSAAKRTARLIINSIELIEDRQEMLEDEEDEECEA